MRHTIGIGLALTGLLAGASACSPEHNELRAYHSPQRADMQRVYRPAYSVVDLADLGELSQELLVGFQRTAASIGGLSNGGGVVVTVVDHGLNYAKGRDGQGNDFQLIDSTYAGGMGTDGSFAGFEELVPSQNNGNQAFVARGGSIARHLAPILSAGQTAGADINDRGDVVGWADSTHGQTAALWAPTGAPMDLGQGLPPNHQSCALGVNATGSAVGYFVDDLGQWAWYRNGSSGQITPGIGSEYGAFVAWDVNDQELVVGETDGLGFLWSEAGGTRELGPVRKFVYPNGTSNPGQLVLFGSAAAYGINNQGTAVGCSWRNTIDPNPVACVWSRYWLAGGTAHWASDLNDMIDPEVASHIKLIRAVRINEHGQILCIGAEQSKHGFRAFILSPNAP